MDFPIREWRRIKSPRLSRVRRYKGSQHVEGRVLTNNLPALYMKGEISKEVAFDRSRFKVANSNINVHFPGAETVDARSASVHVSQWGNLLYVDVEALMGDISSDGLSMLTRFRFQ